jgi:hypothetical protein
MTVPLGSEFRESHDQILLSPKFEITPNLQKEIAVFISLGNRVAQIYPQALGLSN